ncbi:MAG: hypothetical protein FWH17_10420, partial [Oscillospiraceae bacterium]|nr:hypothetical protein [Oscillospiraceae bacterium]
MRGYFFDGCQIEDGKYDREYSASDHADYFKSIFTTGAFTKLDPRACEVTTDGSGLNRYISVAPGRVFISGYCGITDGDDTWHTATLADGRYRVVIRLDLSDDVRAFSCELLHGTATEYPPIVRDGNIYDLCLAQIEIAEYAPTIQDTRLDPELCGTVNIQALPPEPPYYPPGDLPLDLWLYTLFPDTLTPEQREAVEGNPSLRQIWESGRIQGSRAHYGTSSSTGSPLVATMQDGSTFVEKTGAIINVRFTNALNRTAATNLQPNGGTARAIQINGAAVSATNPLVCTANTIISFV